jgi:hypothetical protein
MQRKEVPKVRLETEESEAAFAAYREKSDMLPMPTNAEEHRAALIMLDSMPEKAELMSHCIKFTDRLPNELIAGKWRQWERGIIGPDELYMELVKIGEDL